LEDPGRNERIILQRVLGKWSGRMWTESTSG
jgi:hypothetical protein